MTQPIQENRAACQVAYPHEPHGYARIMAGVPGATSEWATCPGVIAPGFRAWARLVLGPEAGDQVSDQYAAALARDLDEVALYGTTRPIQENTMRADRIQEVSDTVDAGLTQDDYDGLSEAERLGLIVGAAYGGALAERDHARDLAVRLEQELAEARRHLGRMVVLAKGATTWATDTNQVDEAEAFLNGSGDQEGLESPETPDNPQVD